MTCTVWKVRLCTFLKIIAQKFYRLKTFVYIYISNLNKHIMKDFKVLDFQEADGVHNGSSLKGYINATYSQLIEVLGEPTYDEPSGDEKTQMEWVVEFNDEIFTIYDWKTFSREYTQNELTRFNVGGTTYAGDFTDKIESLTKFELI